MYFLYHRTAPANVTITATVVLTIAPTGILEVDFANHSLTVTDTGGVLVKQGGSLAQTGRLTPPPQGGTANLLVFHHSDHLTGASVDTDATGTLLQLTDYYPFGDSRIEDTTTAYHNDYTYTGKERDEDTELLYYEARYYDSTIGRFLSLDPWSGDITDPQSFNKYAYVRNNPLKYRDPDGRAYVGFTDEEVAFYERVHNGQFVGPLSPKQQERSKEYERQRSMKQTVANAGRFDGLLFEALESDEEKARENYAANYDKILTDDDFSSFSDADYLDHANLLDDAAQESLGSALGIGKLKKAKVVGEKITGYTRHGIDNAISKNGVGVKAGAIVDALRNPIKIVQQANGTVKQIGRDATVVLNKAGKVVTTWARNRNGMRK